MFYQYQKTKRKFEYSVMIAVIRFFTNYLKLSD